MNFRFNLYLVVMAALVAAMPCVVQAQSAASAPSSATTAPAQSQPQLAANSAQVYQWRVDSLTAAQNQSLGNLNPKGDYVFQVDCTNQGASVDTLELSNYFMKVDDKQLYRKLKDEDKYKAEADGNPKKYGGHYKLLNPVTSPSASYLPLETRSLKLVDKDQALEWNKDGKLKYWKKVETPATTGPADGQQNREPVSYEWTLYRGLVGEYKPFLKLTKTYSLHKNGDGKNTPKHDYTLYISLKVENLSGEVIKNITIDQAGPSGLAENPSQGDTLSAYWGRAVYKDGDAVTVHSKAVKDAVSMAPGVHQIVGWLQKNDDPNKADPIVWIGMANKFFGSMMYLENSATASNGYFPGKDDKVSFYEAAAKDSNDAPTFITGVDVQMELAAGQSKILNFQVFAGPKDRDMLENKGDNGKEIYQKLNYIGIVDVNRGGCSFCVWQPLTFGMMWLLVAMANTVGFGNYGVAIILLVVLVRVLLHPLTKKGQVSMMKMQKMGPMMNKLKEKYANDKEALNREMVVFYKQQGAAPIMGCLPMILQMPIWIALYTACSISVELRHAAFLPIWLTDLAAPDAFIPFATPLHVPLLGWSIYSLNLLPLLLAVATVLQAKFTPQSSPPGSSDAAKQQKMMMYMMPVMMLVFFYSMPSGLTLYIMASTFAGVAEQWVIRRHIRQKEALEAAIETTVAVPGKGSRSSRAKKPKGPNWVKNG